MESLDNMRSLSFSLRTFIRPCSGFNRIEDGEEVLNASPLSSFIHPNTFKPVAEASLSLYDERRARGAAGRRVP